jgi:acetyl-CoA synthetase
MTEVIWRPTPDAVEHANVTRLMRRQGIAEFRELVRCSQEEPEWFWPAVVEDLGLDLSPWERVYDDSKGIEWTTWFPGSTLNLATSCVHHWAAGSRREERAAIFRGEDGARREVTFGELSREVTLFAEALARLGVRAGDRVALYLPMSPEIAIASHACAHLGAIQVPVFSGFAAPAVAERLVHAEVKVVVTADGSLRRGREQPLKETVDEALAEAPSVEHVVVWRRLGRDCPMTPRRDLFWEDAVVSSPGTLEPLPVEAEHPYLIAYTSGTTGKPKGAVHVQGGFLVKIAAEAAYEADLHPGDTILFATDMGWIMGPWTVVGAGALGAAVVFMEGSPDWPGPDRLWQLCAEERVTALGLSPTLVRSLIPHGEELVRRHDRSSLRTLVTTGEPWNPEPYRWLAETVGDGRVPIINISGGTEVAACFLSCTHVEPIKTCSLGFPALGMAIDCVDEQGRTRPPGEVGELVCRRAWPGMTRGFWRDPDRYLDTYWRRIPGLWVHGDWASVDEDGYWYLHGRSDDTLNIAGKRIGPAELESAAVGHPAVLEAAAVGIPHAVKGEVAWLFCVTAPGYEAGRELAAAVADGVARALGKAFRPERVVFVPSLPRTRSAKIVRRAVRASALGQDPGDLSSVENPDALEAIARAL